MGKRLLLLAPLLLLFTADGHSDTRFSNLQYQRIDNILRTKVMSVDFQDTTLKEVMGFIHTVTGINIVVDPALLREMDTDALRVTLAVNDLSAGDVLDLILKFKGIGRCYRHGVLVITTLEKSTGKPILRCYDVRDLTFKIQDFPGPNIELKGSDDDGSGPVFTEDDDEGDQIDVEMVSDLIRSTCGGTSWDDNTEVRMTEVNGVLWVRQTTEVHVEILTLLSLLRGLR